MFTKREIEAFTTSDCWVLAKALHDITGMEMHIFSHEWDPNPRDEEWFHFFVMTPDRMCLDIEGLRTPRDMNVRWMDSVDDYSRAITVDEYPDLVCDQERGYPEYDALDYASRVLDSYFVGNMA